MKIKEFRLERLYARYKKKSKYMLSNVSCESITKRELLELADSECMALWENLDLGYTDVRGFGPLREAISKRYTTVRPSDILDMTPEEGIFIFMNVLLNPGDVVFVMQPCFPSLYELPRALGCEVIKWPMEITSWGWRLDLNFLSENITPKTKLIVLNIPNNPTGYIPVKTEIDRVLNIADKMGAWVFCEETFRGMEHDPGGAIPSISDMYHHAVTLGGLNKFGLPGTRMGWLISKNHQFLSECSAYKDYTTYCNNAPGEVLATIAMRNADTLLKRNHQIVLENLGLAEAFFKQHNRTFNWIQPNGGCTAFPQLLPPFDVTEMCEKAMEEKDMLIVGDRMFEMDTNHFRLGIGRKDFPMTLGVFKSLIEEMEAEVDAED